jgi:hypothetical protein
VEPAGQVANSARGLGLVCTLKCALVRFGNIVTYLPR